MRYYIEAFDRQGGQILGNLDGQAALGELRRPRASKAWLSLFNNPARHTRVSEFRLVDATGTIIARLAK